MAKKYYLEFKKQMEEDSTKKLKIATIFSYGANEAEVDDGNGIIDDENPEDTSKLDQSARDFLDMYFGIGGNISFINIKDDDVSNRS